MRLKFSIIVVCMALSCFSYSDSENLNRVLLNNALAKMGRLKVTDYISIEYEQSVNLLHHGKTPWASNNYIGMGALVFSESDFTNKDKLSTGDKTYSSIRQYTENKLFILDYGDNELSSINQENIARIPLELVKFTPYQLLLFFLSNSEKIELVVLNDKYKLNLFFGSTRASLFIEKTNFIVSQIDYIEVDVLYGNVLSSVYYNDYVKINDSHITPAKIRVEKFNGHVIDDLEVTSYKLVSNMEKHFVSEQYKSDIIDVVNVQSTVSMQRISDSIHLIKIKSTDTASILIEFNDFFVIGDVPQGIDNYNLVLNKIRTIDPAKPIKYYLFTHHHPDYIGGLKHFNKLGAIPITHRSSLDYVNEILKSESGFNKKNNTTLNYPLALSDGVLTITDGEFEMSIIVLGKESNHTLDYLVYYFPKEEILYQGDLISIPKSGKRENPSAAQKALLNLINENSLKVNTVIQSWPQAQYSLKTIIPIEDVIISPDSD